MLRLVYNNGIVLTITFLKSLKPFSEILAYVHMNSGTALLSKIQDPRSGPRSPLLVVMKGCEPKG